MLDKLAIVAMVVMVSGCVEATNITPTENHGDYFPQPGAIIGTVKDDEARPLEGIVITLVEQSDVRLTDAEGAFAFEDLAAGNYSLVLSAPEYPTEVRSVVVVEGEEQRVDFHITKLPEFQPYSVTMPFIGQYDCAGEYFIITGDCGILVEFASCTAGYCTSDPAFAEKYQFPINVEARWETIIAELTWTAAANNGLDGMRMYIENTNVSAQGGHAKKVARVDGNEQPLTIRLDRGTIRPEADTYNGTTQKAFIPDEGGPEQIRVFPKGHAWDITRTVCEPTRGCLLGVGAGVSIDFVVYVTIFYNEPAPSEFTAVPEE